MIGCNTSDLGTKKECFNFYPLMCRLINCLVSRIPIVFNQKFLVLSQLLVYVGPDWKPKRQALRKLAFRIYMYMYVKTKSLDQLMVTVEMISIFVLVTYM